MNQFSVLNMGSSTGSDVSVADNSDSDDFNLEDADLELLDEMMANNFEDYGDGLDDDDFDVSNPTAILDALAGFKDTEAKKPDLKRKLFPSRDIKLKDKQVSEKKPVPASKEPIFTLYSQGEDVYISDGIIKHLCGKTSMHFDDIIIMKANYVHMASTLSEETSSKGTCLGYSSLIHSAAILAVDQGKGLIEPMEGNDLILNGKRFEITGHNWQRRITSTDVTLSKYILIEFISSDLDDVSDCLNLSNKEDSYDTSGFVKTALDQDKSPYTPIVDELHNISRKIDKAGMSMIYSQILSYFSRLDPITEKPKHIKPDSEQLRVALLKGSKRIDGNNLLPSPFRVLSGQYIDPEYMMTYNILPYTKVSSVGTTFHNFPVDSDYESFLLSKPINSIDVPTENNQLVFRWLYSCLLNYSVFQSIYIESELFSKIQGSKGCFYSKHSKVGISWKIHNAGSLTYYVSYYCKGKQPESCGIWRQLNTEDDIWQSATFNVNLSDIEYAKVLPHRLYTCVSSIIAYTEKSELTYVVQRIMIMAGMMRSSSWQTSALAGDMRFITLCACSSSGDMKSMVDKIAGRVEKPLTTPDAIFIKRMIKFADGYETRDISLTPMMQFPMRFLSLEKDIANTMMWHIRGLRHSTECFKKVIKGIHQEKSNRDEILMALETQLEYLRKSFTDGVTQDEFDELMEQMPTFAYYNHVMFLGLCYASADTLDVGYSQEPTPVCLTNLVSDHHSTMIKNPERIEASIISTPKVADGLNALINQYMQPPGIHTLITRMSRGKKLTNIYTIHPKDSKSKNREIPQMTNYMRVTQFMSESLLTIYTKGEESDMMQNPDKYSDFVNKFAGIMKKGGVSRSEDKEFFCGNMHPECMALATATVARITGSTSLVTAAAIQRCNKSRWTVLPKDCEENIIEGISDVLPIFIKEGKKLRRTFAIKNNVHMMQGVMAIGAALVNTVFTTGIDKMQRDVLTDIEETAVFTTSDDSVRGAVVKRDNAYDREQVLNDYIHSAPKLMIHCMMVDSADKPVESTRLAEFNNVATGPNGMFHQQFMHSHLCIQPLLGLSVMEDIINVISNARMSITWGDSIDMARAAYTSNVILLQQKWLLTRAELMTLYDMGILPDSDEDIISGQPRLTNEVKVKLLRMVNPEDREMLINGEVSLIDALRSIRVMPEKKKKKIELVDYRGSIKRLKLTFDQINSSRKIKAKQRIYSAKRLRFDKRAGAKNLFMNKLNEPTTDATEEEVAILGQIQSSPIIKIIPSPLRKTSFMPMNMGNKVRIMKDYNEKSILAWRCLNVRVGMILTDEEQEIANMNDVDFKRWWCKRKQQSIYNGLEYNSPSGRPMLRMHNSTYYSRPQTFNFIVSTVEPIEESSNLTIGGIYYTNVIPCFYGEFMLNKARVENLILAYAYHRDGDIITVFYMLHKSRPKSFKLSVPDLATRYIRKSMRDKVIICPLKKDFSPIKDGSHGMTPEKPYNALLSGDSTAMLNYGNFMNTSSRFAVDKMKKIFNHYKSDFPYHVSKIKPNYPYHRVNSINVEFARVNHLDGSNCISMLRLIPGDSLVDQKFIDLHGSMPVVNIRDDVEVEELWGDM